MQNDLELSPAAQSVLAELTRYHSERLFQHEQMQRKRRALDDRHKPAQISRAIHAMAEGGLTSGPERQFFNETARLAYGGNIGSDPNRIWVPLSALTRDLNAASAGAGGFLVDAVTMPARDLLKPWSFTLQAGVQVEESMTGNAMVPVCDADTTIYWAPLETTEASPSQPTFQNVALRPKIAIGVIQASRNFMKQADPERWIRQHLLRAAGRIVDQAVLNGTGASGQPLGILRADGVSSVDGAAFAWADALAMKKNAALANAPSASVSFVSTPGVRELLEAREKAAGNGFIWTDDRIASCSAFATTDMAADTILCGPMSQVFFGLWGAGILVEVNPFDPALFKSGVVQIRVLAAVDVAIVCDRSAFTVASSVN